MALVTISPTDPAGVFTLTPILVPPLIAADEKHIVFTQGRSQSVLYIANGLK
jgi:hypothetical protein